MADVRESLAVAAPADAVYDLVADLPRMGEWSPECERVTWRGGATSAVSGAHFLGYNRAGLIRWMTQGEVVTAANNVSQMDVVKDSKNRVTMTRLTGLGSMSGYPTAEMTYGYDNAEGKGDHRHYGNKEMPYKLTSVKKLIEDFKEK